MSGPRIAFVLSGFGGGGVERMMVNLAQGLAVYGCAVDLLIDRIHHDYFAALPESARRIELRGSETARRVFIEDYLREEQPRAAMASKLGAAAMLLEARRSAPVPVKVVVRVGTTVSLAVRRERIWTRWQSLRILRHVANEADAIVAVSRGVAEDVARLAPEGRAPVHVIANPVVTPSLLELAAKPVAHPWFTDEPTPVVLSVGRFSRAKDYPTLLRAFALLRSRRACRLVIFGDGRQRPRLERLVRRLGVSDSVDLPGFVANPYPYAARARVFVLSSLWEGSPNALAEALALGTPVVATDCPSGPRELLRDGRYGRLTPPGDPDRLAEAIEETLDNPLPADVLREAVREYTVEKSAARYLEVLGIAPAGR